MKIGILDARTYKVVYITEVNLAGGNYKPGAKEYEDLAWGAAVEDSAVKDEDRKNYVFQPMP